MFRLVGPRAGDVDTSLVVAKDTGADITLSWDASCGPADTDYGIYEGIPGDFTSHASLFCGTDESTTKTFTPSADDAYYLVVPLNPMREGSYGKDSDGRERPAGQAACLPQQTGDCE